MILLTTCFIFAFLAFTVQAFIKKHQHKELLLKNLLRMSFTSLVAFILFKVEFTNFVIEVAKILAT